MPVFVASVVFVGQHQQVAGIAPALQTKQTAGQEFPELRGVKGVDGAGGCVCVTQSAWIRGMRGLVHQRVDQFVVAVDPLRRVGAQRAIRRVGAICRVVVERGLKPGLLVDVLLDRAHGRVDGAVQHHRPHMVAELLDVGGPQFGAVAEAEVVDLVVA